MTTSSSKFGVKMIWQVCTLQFESTCYIPWLTYLLPHSLLGCLENTQNDLKYFTVLPLPAPNHFPICYPKSLGKEQ